jgi:hypothetical protein
MNAQTEAAKTPAIHSHYVRLSHRQHRGGQRRLHGSVPAIRPAGHLTARLADGTPSKAITIPTVNQLVAKTGRQDNIDSGADKCQRRPSGGYSTVTFPLSEIASSRSVTL